MKRYYMTEGGALCERTDDHGRALIPHTIIARADACDRLNSLTAEVERAYQVLESYGVTRDRAKVVANGIDVLATRDFKAARVSDDALYDLNRQLTAARERIKALEEALEAYGNHDSKCLLSQRRAGMPTEGGDYETLYGYGDKAKWYRGGERPECTCGFDAALAGGKE